MADSPRFRAVPAKGRIVHYHDQVTGEALAAIVTKVYNPNHPESVVNLFILYEDGGLDFRKLVPHGPGKFGHWSWPQTVPPVSSLITEPSRD